MSCKQCDQRQNRQQGNRKSAVFLPEHCVNTDHRASVCKHADDTGGKQRFQRINISDEPGCDRSCVHFTQRICGQLRQLFAHLTAQTVSQLLSEYDQKAFPRRFQQSRQCCHAEIRKCLCNRHRVFRSQPVHDFSRISGGTSAVTTAPTTVMTNAIGSRRFCVQIDPTAVRIS